VSDPRLESLLQHANWVQRLAQSLTNDSALAADLAQEAWLSTLRRAPRDARSPRGWLATLVRRHLRQLHRGERRRASREAERARELAEPSAADVVARAEAARLVAEAVLALREPYRSTVLQRYFDELEPAEIAARARVPIATVHSRLARGLALLRERLGADHRRGLAGVLAAWLPRRPRAQPCAAGIAVGLVGLAVALRVPTRASEAPVLARRTEEGRVGVEAALQRPSSRAEREPAPSTSVPASTPRPLRHALVLDPTGAPVPGVAIALADSKDAPALHVARSDAAGAVSFPAPERRAALWARDERFETVLACELEPGREDHLAVVVAPSTSFAGRVLDADGAPAANAFVALRIDPALAVAFERALDFNRPVFPFVLTDAAGRFRFERVPALHEARVVVTQPGWLGAEAELPAAGTSELLLWLTRPGPEVPRIRGEVRDARGRPVAGARVAVHPTAARSDAHGRFELVLWPPPKEARLVAWADGHGGAWLEPERDARGEPRWPAFASLVLPERPGVVRGRVRDAGGRAVAGARVWLTGTTLARPSAEGPLALENLLAEPNAPVWRWVESDADGAFVLDGLLEREYGLCAADPRDLASAHVRVRPGEQVELELCAAEALVAGRAHDLEGRPLAGVAVELALPALELEHGDELRTYALALPVARTDEHGRFAFPRSATAGARLRLAGDGIVPLELALDGRHDLAALELAVARRAHLGVELATPTLADAFEARDARGEPVTLVQLRESCSHAHRRAPLVGGRSLVFVAPEDVRELVLFAREVEVGRRPVVLAPGSLTRVAW
jgi:RNA polymerase sigma-70 factor (ECF subfamily)